MIPAVKHAGNREITEFARNQTSRVIRKITMETLLKSPTASNSHDDAHSGVPCGQGKAQEPLKIRCAQSGCWIPPGCASVSIRTKRPTTNGIRSHRHIPKSTGVLVQERV